LIVHEHARDFESGVCDGCHVSNTAPSGLVLDHDPGNGVFTSAPISLEQPASKVVLSLNITRATSGSTGVQGMVQAQISNDWTPWFHLMTWGLSGPDEGIIASSHGTVHTDVLKLQSASAMWRYRVTWRAEGEASIVHRVSLSFAIPQDEQVSALRSAWGTRLDVPFLSQWNAMQHPPERVCSPTSVAMVTGFYGCSVSADEVAAAVYDKQHDIYGNWSLNVLAISRLGFEATVEHAGSLRFLEDSIQEGHPIVASIAYADGALPGAAKPASDGHLVVVSGFTDLGDVITRDPAARGDDAWLTYPREEFARAWLDHGGVVYRITPEVVS
jgi:hypothetical protein